MYHTTGLSKDEIVELCAMIHPAASDPADNRWPPSLRLFNSVVITLTYWEVTANVRHFGPHRGGSEPVRWSPEVTAVTSRGPSASTRGGPLAEVRGSLGRGGQARSELTNMNLGSKGVWSLIANNCGRI